MQRPVMIIGGGSSGMPQAKMFCMSWRVSSFQGFSSPVVESELFGHERGAFTGAVGSKPGRFELADGGTLFLDEIGEVPLEMQVKLLRALQESEFERVGGSRPSASTSGWWPPPTATSRRLITEGRFREDLYYRLEVVPIALPPLRERREDIPLLVAALPREVRPAAGQARRGDRARGARAAHGLRLAGQHPRAREPHGALGAVRGRPDHPRQRPARLAARAGRRSRPDAGRGRRATSAPSPRRAAPR